MEVRIEKLWAPLSGEMMYQKQPPGALLAVIFPWLKYL